MPTIPRVLHVDTGRVWRGGQNQVRLLVAELERGRAVQQAVMTAEGSRLQTAIRELGVPVHSLGSGAPLDPRTLLRLTARLGKGWHIIHAHDSHSLQTAVAALALSGRPTRLVASRRMARPVRTPWIWRRAHLVLAVSRHARDQLLRQGIEHRRAVVVHDGIDPAEVAGRSYGDGRTGQGTSVSPSGDPGAGLRELAGAGPDDSVIAAVGALDPGKDMATLVRAAAPLVERHPRTRYVIAGEGPERESLERLIVENGLSERFALPGFVPDVAQRLREVDVFVTCARDEGLGTATLEALAAGVPVVVAAAGGPSEISGGRLPEFPPGDAAALATLISELLDSADRRASVARAGRGRLEAFTATRMADRTLACYGQLIDGDGECS